MDQLTTAQYPSYGGVEVGAALPVVKGDAAISGLEQATGIQIPAPAPSPQGSIPGSPPINWSHAFVTVNYSGPVNSPTHDDDDTCCKRWCCCLRG